MAMGDELKLPSWCRRGVGGASASNTVERRRIFPRWIDAVARGVNTADWTGWQQTLEKFQLNLSRLLQVSGSCERKLGSLEVVNGFSRTMSGAGSTMLDYLRYRGEEVRDEGEALRKACYQKILINSGTWFAMMQLHHQLSLDGVIAPCERRGLTDRVVDGGYIGELASLERFFVSERNKCCLING